MSEYKDVADAFDIEAREAGVFDSDVHQIVRRALLIADRLGKEPSEGMVDATGYYHDVNAYRE